MSSYKGKLVSEQGEISDESGIRFASTGTTVKPYKEQDANAAELCHRWNCHEQLVEALKFAAGYEFAHGRIFGDVEPIKSALEAAKKGSL